jgi:hypothetical protein
LQFVQTAASQEWVPVHLRPARSCMVPS